ncbi:uncharacterized protein LOC141664963 [Apium graveolens]|uniref:uncharacterized protein LOC141664963 n=1 Tax=Apium graveolens TaxID=4045 RepID=UPI003D78C8D2
MAFEKLKKYMVQAPLLAKPVLGETLYLYLVVSENAISVILVKEDLKVQKPIYYPLRNIIHVPKSSERLINWAIELGEFDIKYKLQTAIKAQALADFVIECTIPNQEVGGHEDTILQGMEGKEENEGEQIKNKKFWLDFPTTNNKVEYEALIAGPRLAGTLRVENLKVCGDSKLVISQVKGEFEARDETMAKYVRLVRAVMTQFDECHVEHISRE